MSAPMCAACTADYLAWIDHKSSPPLHIHTIGGSARDVADARRLRADDHYALVRRQTAMIRKQCADAQHVMLEEFPWLDAA